MKAKLILLAEKITFDELGRVSATNLLLDVAQPIFPAQLPNVDVLTCFTRLPEEPEKTFFQIIVETSDGPSEPTRVPIDFQGRHEVFQGISLDDFELKQPGPVIFRFIHGDQDLATWILRGHEMHTGGTVGEAK